MIAIEAGRVFDGERFLAGGARVLLDGARIADVEPATAPAPEDVQRLQFPDGTLLPGLIDTHVHLCGDGRPNALERLVDVEDAAPIIEAALDHHLAAGVTTVRDLGDLRWAVIDWRRQARNGRPAILGSGPPITVPNGHCWAMGGAVDGDDALRQAVGERARRGVDIVKIMASGGLMTPGTDASRPQFSRGQIALVVREAHAAGLPVTAHAHAKEAIRYALDAGVDAIEHCSFVTESGIDPDPVLVAELVRSQIPVCPTLGYAQGVTPPPVVLELMRRTGSDYPARVRTVVALHEAGVRLVSGSDGGINHGKRHGVLPESLIHLARGGVPADAVLATATSIAADACGLGKRKGRLAKGFDADLLLVDGPVETRIEAIRDVAAVFIGGERRR